MGQRDPNPLHGSSASKPDESGAGTGQTANQISELSKSIVEMLFKRIKTEARSVAAEQLDLASTKLESFAEVLGETASNLRMRQNQALADLIESGTESISHVSDYLRKASPEKVIGGIEDFARNRPGTFLGAALVSGFLLGQLFSNTLKSTVHEVKSKRESSIEYSPGKDEEEYYVPH